MTVLITLHGISITWGTNLASAKVEMRNYNGWNFPCVVPGPICCSNVISICGQLLFCVGTVWILFRPNSVGGDMSGVLTQKIVVFICFHMFSSVFSCTVPKADCFHRSCFKVSLVWAIFAMVNRTHVQLQVPKTVRKKKWKTRSDKAGSGTPWPSTFNWPEICFPGVGSLPPM